MCDSLSSTERQQDDDKDMLELNKNVERMIEDVENISVELTWMAYDMVVQRTSPEQVDTMRRLEDAYKRCKAFICREEDDSELNKEPKEDKCPEPVENPSTTPLS